METFLGFAAGPTVLVGLFTGLTAWFARTVLRDTRFGAPIVVTIAVSIIAAGSLLVALGNWALIAPGLGGYGLGLLVSSVIYVSLYRLGEGHWPVRSRPRRPHC